MRVHAYDAFISYSHAKDRSIAAALQKVMQTLGKAWWQRRSLRIFRDETSLTATPELWPTIEAALTSSRFLLLMASPEAAHSEWVDKEVTTWLAHRGPEDGLRTLLIALTDGEPRGTSAPAALRRDGRRLYRHRSRTACWWNLCGSTYASIARVLSMLPSAIKTLHCVPENSRRACSACRSRTYCRTR